MDLIIDPEISVINLIANYYDFKRVPVGLPQSAEHADEEYGGEIYFWGLCGVLSQCGDGDGRIGIRHDHPPWGFLRRTGSSGSHVINVGVLVSSCSPQWPFLLSPNGLLQS